MHAIVLSRPPLSDIFSCQRQWGARRNSGSQSGWQGQTRLTVLLRKRSPDQEDTLKLRLGVAPIDQAFHLPQTWRTPGSGRFGFCFDRVEPMEYGYAAIAADPSLGNRSR
jgi:hypothetical protein